jgi:hypothetical protein
VASGLIVEYLGYGLSAARPTTPAVPTNGMACYWSTDASPGSEFSVYANGAWHVFASGAAVSDGDKGDISVVSGVWAIDNNVVTTAKIANAAVTLAKIANAAANSKLVGSGAAGSGSAYAEISLGTNLSMSGTTLNAGGDVLIQRQSAAGVTALAFSSIPGTYDELVIRGRLKSSLGNTGLTGVRVNSDSGSNYQTQLQAKANGDVSVQSLTQTQYNFPTVSAYNNWSMYGSILDYADTVASKHLNMEGVASYGGAGGLAGSGGMAPFELAGLWGPTTPAAITRLDFNFLGTVTAGWIALYGRNY